MTEDRMFGPTPEEMVAPPDAFVCALPCPWELAEAAFFEEVHGEHWHQGLDVALAPREGDAAILASGTMTFEDGVQARVWVEPPLPELLNLTPASREPYSASEIVALEQHRSVWRVVIEGGRPKGRRGARHAAEIMATFIAAGASGALMPGLITLHSPRMIQRHTMQPYDPQAQTNLFVGATHDEEGAWMWTRGLTAFGLPELETPVHQGMNDAYFRLMDVAANMILQLAPFEEGRRLQIGHQTFEVRPGPQAPEDVDAAINGAFGRLTITPR